MSMLRQGSVFGPCRVRLLLLARSSSSSAFTGYAVAQARFQGLGEEVLLIVPALLLLHAHRISRSCSLAVGFGPSSFRTITASADFSFGVDGRCRPSARITPRPKEISQGKTLILHSVAVDSPARVSAWLLGIPVRCRVTPPHRPSIRFLFVNSELCFRLPPHLASRRRSCLPLSVPANRPEKDFHL